MKKLVAGAGILILSVILAACAAGRNAASKSINVTMTDFQFTPNSFTVPAGQQINFTATNNGGVEHSFVIMDLGKKVQDHFTDQDQANVYWEKTGVAIGQTVHASFTAPSQPGDYQIVCAVPGHFEAGMTGTLKVVNAQGQ